MGLKFLFEDLQNCKYNFLKGFRPIQIQLVIEPTRFHGGALWYHCFLRNQLIFSVSAVKWAQSCTLPFLILLVSNGSEVIYSTLFLIFTGCVISLSFCSLFFPIFWVYFYLLILACWAGSVSDATINFLLKEEITWQISASTVLAVSQKISSVFLFHLLQYTFIFPLRFPIRSEDYLVRNVFWISKDLEFFLSFFYSFMISYREFWPHSSSPLNPYLLTQILSLIFTH